MNYINNNNEKVKKLFNNIKQKNDHKNLDIVTFIYIVSQIYIILIVL